MDTYVQDCNSIGINRRMDIVASYLKGTALTWFNRAGAREWDNPLLTNRSFVHLFQQQFCNPFKMSQWKHQLRNRKQKPGETIEEYVAVMEELWKRIDPEGRRTELDRIHEFIEGLRSEFIVPVQSSMPGTVIEAIEKARAVETAFSIGMELSAYSMIPGYLNGMGGTMLPARTNMATYQPAYATGYSKDGHPVLRLMVFSVFRCKRPDRKDR